jgi:protein-disulfide isomerase
VINLKTKGSLFMTTGMSLQRVFLTLKASRVLAVGCAVGLLNVSGLSLANDNQPAFKIGGKVTTMGEIYKQEQGNFFEIEKKKYELIEGMAKERYLENFWQQKAKESGKSEQEARTAYFNKNLKVSDREVKETLDKFKEHPQLKKLSKEEQEKQVREYLSDKQRREIMDNIISDGMKKGDLVISVPKPQEPVYTVAVKAHDPVRYGPNPDDIKPAGCEGNSCPITIVEYSEFQCPFCKRVIPASKQIMTEYKGKARWITRDFPLSFHDRAKPAAVAARCAGKQNKYWHMYTALFDNQSNLADEDFKKYASKISGLDMKKWEACVSKPDEQLAIIEESIDSGVKLGVTGTPAYFINGRRLSGALPFEEFKRVIDEELSKGKKS